MTQTELTRWAPSESQGSLISKSIVERLKCETRVLHEQIELVVGIMRPDIDRSDYARYLATLLGYYTPLERQLLELSGLRELVPDLGLRCKVPLLEHDLRSLGLSDAAIASTPRCQELPALGDASRALGVLYVLEGSTLGGQVIGRHLRLRLPTEVAAAASFLRGYAENTGSMWQEFRRVLTASARSVTEEDQMVAAAADTFVSLRNWFEVSTSRHWSGA